MSLLGVKVDIDAAMRGVESIQKDKLPLIIARSLTAVAQEGQKAARLEEDRIFKTRNDWTVRNTKITPATRQKLVAEVYTDTANRTTGAPDYMLRHETGGEKVPVNGREHIAVPTNYLRQLSGGADKPIPDWLRPKALLKYVDTQTYTTRRGKTRGQPAAIHGLFFFKVRLKSGGWAILTRAAGADKSDAYPLYNLVTAAHIRAAFPMDKVVEETVDAEFAQIFEAIAEDVGISVKV